MNCSSALGHICDNPSLLAADFYDYQERANIDNPKTFYEDSVGLVVIYLL